MSTYKVKDAKQAAVEVGELTLVSLIACAILQYKLVTLLVAKSRQLLKVHVYIYCSALISLELTLRKYLCARLQF